MKEGGKLGRDGYYGWMGYGGSVFQWHPRLRIGIAYAPTILEWFDMENNKARILQVPTIAYSTLFYYLCCRRRWSAVLRSSMARNSPTQWRLLMKRNKIFANFLTC